MMPPIRHDPERVIDLDLVRCTENAALAAWKYFGKGDKNAGRRAPPPTPCAACSA